MKSKIEILYDSLLLYYVTHRTKCDIDYTDFCTCGLRELKENIRQEQNRIRLQKLEPSPLTSEELAFVREQMKKESE